MKSTFRSILAASALMLTACATPSAPSEPREALSGVKTVLVLGDSITYAGQYVEDLEAWTSVHLPDLDLRFINVGLPSEVVSGLSEEGHAGGKFPRPDLHERLERVLNQIHPDLALVCYGMNDGIYLPFDEGRFQRFQEGIEWVRAQLKPTGARILHLTPPPFDEIRGGHPGYADTLHRYSEWLLEQRTRGWDVLDLNGRMTEFLQKRREADPKFALADDGVHPGALGHWLMAKEVLEHWGASFPTGIDDIRQAIGTHPQGEKVLELVQKKQRVLKDAWLSETRHQRPGMKPGLPLAEAEAKSADLDQQIRALTRGR